MAANSDSRPLLPREVEALTFIGEGYEVAQYQLHASVFGSVSETVVSRFVRRAVERDFIVAQRLHGFGLNRLRLTRRGKDALLRSGETDQDLIFTPRNPVALKDLAHTLLINDLKVALMTQPNRPDSVTAAWALARRGRGLARLVPDLLAIWSETNTRLACEVDLGCEPLTAVFLPKLRSLCEALRSSNRRSGVLVLTRGMRRAALLREFAMTLPTDASLMTFTVGTDAGLSRIEELRRIFLL